MGKSKKRGRKITPHRQPNGQLSRAGETSGAAPAKLKRLRTAAIAGMADARWATELGRLYLAERITEVQFLAGEYWAETARRYHEAIDAPASDPRSAALERGAHGAPPDPGSEVGLQIVSHDCDAVDAMNKAHRALLVAGKLPESTVRAACERNEYVGEFELDHLKNGLNVLVLHWHLTPVIKFARKAR